MGSPKVANHEILGAQHLSLYEKRTKTFPVGQGKSYSCRLWRPGVSRAQPCNMEM